MVQTGHQDDRPMPKPDRGQIHEVGARGDFFFNLLYKTTRPIRHVQMRHCGTVYIAVGVVVLFA